MDHASVEDALEAILAAGPTILVATRNASLVPSISRGSGLRALGGRRVALMLPRATSSTSIANLETNGQIAVVVAGPTLGKSLQLKGRVTALREQSPSDLLASERQFGAFADAIAPFGFSRAKVRNSWLFDSVRVEFVYASVFVQNPGPEAGARWELGDDD